MNAQERAAANRRGRESTYLRITELLNDIAEELKNDHAQVILHPERESPDADEFMRGSTESLQGIRNFVARQRAWNQSWDKAKKGITR